MRATRVLSLSIAMAAASLLAHAQTFAQVQVNLPHGFTAGTTQLPAGDYEIRPLADQPNTFGFYKDGLICKSIVHATPIEKSGADVDPSLVLKVQGERYQLSQLWIDGMTGFQFSMPHVASTRESEVPRSLVIKARRG